MAYKIEQNLNDELNGLDLYQRIECKNSKDSKTFSFQIEYKPRSDTSIFSLLQ